MQPKDNRQWKVISGFVGPGMEPGPFQRLFEERCLLRGINAAALRCSHGFEGEYNSNMVQGMWEGWVAAAEQAADTCGPMTADQMFGPARHWTARPLAIPSPEAA